MTKTTKSTILSVVCLMTIALVSVVTLSLANHFLKYVPVLDEKTNALINQICPSGVDDATSFSEGYFKLLNEEDLLTYGINLDKFNKAKGSAKKQVLAVYKCVKGDNSGKFIIESKGWGFVGDIVMLTLIANDGSVDNTICKAQSESLPEFFKTENFNQFVEWSKGRKEFVSDKYVVTGATYSSNGVADAMDVAVKMGSELMEGKANEK